MADEIQHNELHLWSLLRISLLIDDIMSVLFIFFMNKKKIKYARSSCKLRKYLVSPGQLCGGTGSISSINRKNQVRSLARQYIFSFMRFKTINNIFHTNCIVTIIT